MSMPTADLTTIKMLWNSILSTENAKLITADVPNFYLGTPMERSEFMLFPLKIMPKEIITKYKFQDLEEDGWVYC